MKIHEDHCTLSRNDLRKINEGGLLTVTPKVDGRKDVIQAN